MQDTDKVKYHAELKILAKRGCIIFSPKESNGFWEIGIRDQNGEYCRVAFEKELKDAIDVAYKATSQTPHRWFRFLANEDGRAILIIILLLGLIYGVASGFLSAFRF